APAGQAPARAASPQPAADAAQAGNAAIAAMTRRMDTLPAITRVLLYNSTFSEAVTLQRSARLLAGEVADWVLIDIERGGRLLRQFAAGPRTSQADQTARLARGADPDQGSGPG